MIYLLDTNVCIDVLHSHVRKRLSGGLAVSTVVVYELFYGAEKCRLPQYERTKIENFLQTVRIVPFDTDAAKESAKIRAELEAVGRSIGPYDLQIAGHAIALNLILVTANMREFSRIPALRLENWLEG